jgi:hypothetical protein
MEARLKRRLVEKPAPLNSYLAAMVPVENEANFQAWAALFCRFRSKRVDEFGSWRHLGCGEGCPLWRRDGSSGT